MSALSNEKESWNDSTPLEHIFGSPSARLLDFFILNNRFDYSESDISKITKVSPRTLQRVLPLLLEEKLIMRSRKSNKAYMYLANEESERLVKLQEYVNATVKENLRDAKGMPTAAEIPGQRKLLPDN
jgi:DNA-binding transcriptional ArsR family regulator